MHVTRFGDVNDSSRAEKATNFDYFFVVACMLFFALSCVTWRLGWVLNFARRRTMWVSELKTVFCWMNFFQTQSRTRARTHTVTKQEYTVCWLLTFQISPMDVFITDKYRGDARKEFIMLSQRSGTSRVCIYLLSLRPTSNEVSANTERSKRK